MAIGLVRQALDPAQHRDLSLVSQVMRSAVATSLEILSPADDSELPAPLQGKGLILGKPVPVWPVGISTARDGRCFVVDDRAIQSLLADGNGQEFVSFTYDHEDGPRGPENAGYMLHFAADHQFIYSDRTAWTAEAAAKIASGTRGPVSPDAYCEALDPVTHEILTPSSPLFDPATGSYRTNTFRPMYWRAASLVGVPALKNLPPASLSAERTTIAPAAARKECNQMNPKLAKLLGLASDATEEQKSQALSAFKQKLGLPDGATEREILAAAGSFDKPGILALVRSAFKIPDVVKDEMLSDMLDAALEGSACEAAETDSMASAASAPAEAAPAPAPSPEIMATAAAAAVRPFVPQIVKEASNAVRQELAAKQKADAIDAELLAAEKAGKLVPAEREEFRIRLSNEALAAGARAQLAARSGGATVPNGEIVGGALDPSVSVDNLPLAEANEVLSRAAAWHMETGVQFPVALAAVRGGDSAERAFHAQVLSSNPDWGKTGRQKTGARGTRWPAGMRRGLTSVELDKDMLSHIGKQMQLGAIPTNIVPRSLQEAALQRQALAGEVSSFQPTTKFQIAGFGFGFYQGEFGGSEIAPEVTGGANEEASYPVYGTEKLSVHVNAAGVPEPVGRNSEDPERSYWGVDFKKVTLRGYKNEVWASRRDQAAGDAVLPQGVMATVTEQALTIERNKKELVQAAALRLAANYDSTCQKALSSGRQWNDPGSTPIQDWQGARVTVWRAVGVFPEIALIPPDVIETLRFHPDFLKAAQYAGMGNASAPNAMVPLEMLVAILGPMVVPTCRISTTPGGASADTPWGQDVILAVVSKGKVVAPRAFATVVSAGYPVVRGLVNERSDLTGADGVAVSDMYALEVVGLDATATKSAFLFQTATKQLTVVA